jgi:hypothetical protein
MAASRLLAQITGPSTLYGTPQGAGMVAFGNAADAPGLRPGGFRPRHDLETGDMGRESVRAWPAVPRGE